MPTQPQSLLELNQIHRELEDLFYWHQEALLKGDLEAARHLLKSYEIALLNHMKEEEDILLPLYRQRATPARGGDAEFFMDEHKKILEWLGRLKLRLGRLEGTGPIPKGILEVVDDEAHFKKYMEHHSLREDRIFYPEMDRIVEGRERGQLLRLLTFCLEENQPEA